MHSDPALSECVYFVNMHTCIKTYWEEVQGVCHKTHSCYQVGRIVRSFVSFLLQVSSLSMELTVRHGSTLLRGIFAITLCGRISSLLVQE